jgi:alpha-galactosidase
MKTKLISLLLMLAISISIGRAQTTTVPEKPVIKDLTFHKWAPKPPMGWNSWDCFATTVTEAQTKFHADFMAEKLMKYGWEYIVVDIQWYEPNATGFDYRKGAPLDMDKLGRLLPAVKKFPSSANGVGFKALSDYVHKKGLKFGIHLMRGIPRQAIKANTPIEGTTFHAADIADTVHICRWNSDMYGVDVTKPGAQEYYNSVFKLIASWGVDYVKVDDLSSHAPEIAAIRKAIDNNKRPMVLSLSPGGNPPSEGVFACENANVWRISNDFWDNWRALNAQFKRLNDWNKYMGPGHWPDADMLPLGSIGNSTGDITKGRMTNFTKDEQYTLMSLWSIARSPLMYGGDMSKMDDFTLSLLTNSEVMSINQASSNNHQLFNKDGLVAWVADVPRSKDKYLAVFNINNKPADQTATGTKVTVNLIDLGFSKACKVRDLWKKSEVGNITGEFAPEINFHGTGLYRISQK